MDRGAVRRADRKLPTLSAGGSDQGSPGQDPSGPGDAGPDPALTQYRAELNERLVVHWTGGAWRVPLATRHLSVRAADGSALGRIVCAGPADLTRALAGLTPAPPLGIAALEAVLAPLASLLARLRALEGWPGDGWDPEAAARALYAAPPPPGPVALLSAADRPVSEMVGTLARLAGRGVLWKPAPGAAASAHLVLRGLGPLTGSALALLQGDHASGADLARSAAPLWLGRGAPPPQLRGQSAVEQAMSGSTVPSAASSRRS